MTHASRSSGPLAGVRVLGEGCRPGVAERIYAIVDGDGPPNLVGDFGGGGMYLAVGVLAALRGAGLIEAGAAG